MYPRPTQVSYSGEHRLLIAFEDGVRAELDFTPMLGQGGVFAQLSDLAAFRKAAIDPESQALTWPNGADICPDVLYHLATGAPLPGPLSKPPAALIRCERPVQTTP